MLDPRGAKSPGSRGEPGAAWPRLHGMAEETKGGWRRRLTGGAAVWGVAASISAAFVGGTIPTPLYVIYRQKFDLSEIGVTLVFAAYFAGAFGALVVLGRLSDQIGRRRAVLPGIAAAAASAVIFLFADGLAELLIARAINGLAIGLVSGAATAWLAELHPPEKRGQATVVTVAAIAVGLGCGPLISGLLSEWAPEPLVLPYLAFLALLVPVAWLVSRAQETVERATVPLAQLDLSPRLGVPDESRAAFFAPAATAFSTFAMIGFYSAIAPLLLSGTLHVKSHAVGGVIVFALFAADVATVLATRRLDSRRAMLGGLAVMPFCVALLAYAQIAGSLGALVAGALLTGVPGGLAYRGSLQTVNAIAPRGRHGEMVSSLLAAAYTGIAVPVIGVGIVSQLVSASIAALAFAVVIALLAAGAIVMGLRTVPEA